MEIWLEIRDNEINKELNTIGETVTFQVTGTVLTLEQDGINLSQRGQMSGDYFAPRSARILVHTIQRQT